VAGMGYVFTNTDWRARILRPLVRRLIGFVVHGRCARLVVQNQDDLAAFSAARLAPCDHIKLIRSSGVDVSRFQPQPIARRDGTMRVLFAARLLWDKGLREYVEAGRRLRAAGIPVEFLLAGMPDAGNPSSVSPQQIRAWEEEGVVTHLGHVSDMPALLAEVDVAVLPS
jgi:glycosyltransferase involved in cell wall biosynthesis